MYRILKVKKGKQQYKNVIYFYLTQHPSKFYINLVAKKVLHTRPKFFSLSAKSSVLINICYKLNQRVELKKNYTELYLTVTAACFKSAGIALYNKNNYLRKIDRDLVVNFV